MDRRLKATSRPEYGVPGEENSEWTAEDFKRVRPLREVMPEVIAAAKRARGRPKLARPKASLSVPADFRRLDLEQHAHLAGLGEGVLVLAEIFLGHLVDVAGGTVLGDA